MEAEINKPKVDRLIFDSYLAMIRNSVGSRNFASFYAMVEGRRCDIMRNGQLSSAFFVSSILTLFRFIRGIHGTIDTTVADLMKSGWVEISSPRPGAVIVWKPLSLDQDGIFAEQRHIGFLVGDNQAVSNDARKRSPMAHPYTFSGRREIDMILWNPRFEGEYVRPGRLWPNTPRNSEL
jgi:hypothetical protein